MLNQWMRVPLNCLVLLWITSIPIGCGRPSESTSNVTTSTETVPQVDATEETLLEPFDAPALEEIEAQLTWIDLPVADAMELRRQAQLDEKPLVTIEEALNLHNDSPEANEKILSVLGRIPDSESDVDWDDTLVKHLGADVTSLNPIMASTVYDADVNGLTSFGLFGFDWKLRPFALSNHVKTWQTSEDRLIDKIVMRDDLTWSDGEPITAHDIVFSFQTIMNPKVPVPAVRSGTDELRWIEAYDDHTLLVFHKEAMPTNVWNVNFPIIPKHIYEHSIDEDYTLQKSEYHAKQQRDPVCGGPYTIVNRVRGQEIVLERREAWYMHNGKQVRKKPFYKRVRFRIIQDPNTSMLALKSGQIDDFELSPEAWKTQSSNDEFYATNTKVAGTEWSEYHISWNCQTPFFSDVRVRKAMSYAFDYDEMIDKLFYGLYDRAGGPFHKDHWVAPATPSILYEQDFDKAEALLDEAGWTDSDGDGIRDKVVNGNRTPFEFRLICGQHPRPIQIGELLRENLERIGVVCEVRPLEVTVWHQQQLDHKFHAALGGWNSGADPSTSDNVYASDEKRNHGLYSNEQVDQLFEAGQREFDRDKRAKIYGRIHELIYEDQPYTWLYSRKSFYGFNKRLRGYMFSPRGPYHYSPGIDSMWSAVP